MSGERSLRAEQVLARVRASADPALGKAARVLARVERVALDEPAADAVDAVDAPSAARVDCATGDAAGAAEAAAVLGIAGARGVASVGAAAAGGVTASRVVGAGSAIAVVRVGAGAGGVAGVGASPASGIAGAAGAGANATAGLVGLVSHAARAVTPASRWLRVGHVAVRIGRWGLFGLVAGAIGYQLGVRDERAAHEAAPVAASASPTIPNSPSLESRAEPLRAPLGDGQRPAQAAEGATREPPLARPDGALSVRSVPPAAASAVAAPLHATPPRAIGAIPAGATVRMRAQGAAIRSRAPSPTAGDDPAASASNGAPSLSLAEILERLQRAQAALHDSDPHATLAELDALDTSNALEHGGAVKDERRVLRALALCDLGRFTDARHILAELDERGTDSIYRGRLEQSCARALTP